MIGFRTEAVASSGREKLATRQLAETFSAKALDSLIQDAVQSATPIDGADGLSSELTKVVLKRSLQTGWPITWTMSRGIWPGVGAAILIMVRRRRW